MSGWQWMVYYLVMHYACTALTSEDSPPYLLQWAFQEMSADKPRHREAGRYSCMCLDTANGRDGSAAAGYPDWQGNSDYEEERENTVETQTGHLLIPHY